MKALFSHLAATIALCLAVPNTAMASERSPYGGLEERTIKALSSDRIADLRAGNGMGYALAAELNDYPGPRHVIDLADELSLSAEQRKAIEALFIAMRSEAQTLGARLIEREAAIDRLFAGGEATKKKILDATRIAAATEAELRAVHLRYHVETRTLLNQEQVATYNRLRGYTGAVSGTGATPGPGHGHGHAD